MINFEDDNFKFSPRVKIVEAARRTGKTKAIKERISKINEQDSVLIGSSGYSLRVSSSEAISRIKERFAGTTYKKIGIYADDYFGDIHIIDTISKIIHHKSLETIEICVAYTPIDACQIYNGIFDSTKIRHKHNKDIISEEAIKLIQTIGWENFKKNYLLCD